MAPAKLPLPASGQAARGVIREAAAPARRRLAALQERYNRVDAAITSLDRPTPATPEEYAERRALSAAMSDTAREMAASARGVFLRQRPAAFRDGAEPRLDADVPHEVADGIDQWRRAVAPSLVRRVRAPRVRMDSGAPDTGVDGWAKYWDSEVGLSPKVDDWARIAAHEFSHLLEADERTFRRAVHFLGQRTSGEPVVKMIPFDYEALRDKWIEFDKVNESGRWRGGPGGPFPAEHRLYPGRLYNTTLEPLPSMHEGTLTTATGTEYVTATEILSTGVEWMLTNPLAFAEADPEFFDFIWRVVVLDE